MRLTVLLLALALTCVHVKTIAQTVTISGSNLSFKEISSTVKKQTGYLLFVKKGDLSNLKPISVTNMPLKEFLDLLIKDLPLEYSIVDKTIIISPKKNNPPDQSVISSAPAYPNATIVSLKVVDTMGHALVGASVSVKNSKISGITGGDGVVRLPVNENDVVAISFVGYQAINIVITQRNIKDLSMTLGLRPMESRLEEITVVSTGYQNIDREKLTGAVTTVGSKELSKRNAVNILDNLEGIVPGLVRYQNTTTIRGVSTMQANKDVLVVVDGLPIEGSVANINPYDVETINVLKDAAASAIYGARASNGVIVITTKRAKEVGKTVLQVSGNVTYNEKPDYSYYNYMTPSQQVDWESNYYQWWFDGASGTVANPITTLESYIQQGAPISPVQYAYFRQRKDPSNFTKNQLDALLNQYRKNNFPQEYKDNALENLILQQYNIALRTNNGRSQSNLVVNYKTSNEGMINSYNRQLNLFYKGNYSIGKWLDAEYGINTVIGKGRAHNNTFALNPFTVPSYINLFNTDGSRAYYRTNQFNEYNTITETTPKLYSLAFNHLDELERDYYNTSLLNTRYYLNLNFKILPGLTFNPMFQYEDNRGDASAYSEAGSYSMRWLQDVYTTRSGSNGNYTYTNLLPQGGRLTSTQVKSPSYTGRAQATYSKNFEKHYLSVLAGTEFRQARTYGTKGLLLGYDDQLQTQSTNTVNFGSLYNVTSTFLNPAYSPQAFDYPDIVDSMGLINDVKHRYSSAYANLSYVYDSRYSLFGSIRKDYADLFGADKKYRGRPLWSVGAAWILSKENFLRNVSAINLLKLRASYGLTGNIDPTTPSVLTATTGVNSDTQLPNATVTSPPNPQLRWEKTATSNLGIDFYLFNNRLRGAIDWYIKKGTDLFAKKRLDPSEGFTSMVINNASMTNNGFELGVTYDWVKPSKFNDFRWSTGVVASFNKNKITYVDEATTNPIDLATGIGYKTGYPVHALYSYQYAGLDSVGQAQWYNAAGQKTSVQLGSKDINALVYSGGTDPKTAIAFNNDIRYKGFSLNIYMVYYAGHYLRARQSPTPYQTPYYAALPSYLLDSWTPTNKNTDVPGSGQYYRTGLANTQMPYSDFLVRPADFIKIRNIILAYDFPVAITSKLKSTGAQLRLQVNNPRAIWVKQKDVHVDTETGSFPLTTSYVGGFNINF
ncbi:SusC/RagA family TonB-linked outer membrane protein [Pinibacter aurantiacus]|uniref:SusC/RagA family TonB-linked outer membrane protein n=1 Tax=Pinibacter aurantiacus TaxID=2851599 RepID=A0A9E2W7U8_9BACT|nr:SusC/RagA family TonB-linked outer membrane protein [Pinibacter aurantiacus]MBV4357301.1 SusC/RagA family TonB-linked outer membrane protein [Pinibacter aurantiacus]